MKQTVRNGFTMIELLVVIGILAVLAGLSMAGLSYITKITRVKSTSTLVNTIEAAIINYHEKYNDYPPEGPDFNNPVSGPLYKALTSTKTHTFMEAQAKNDVLIDAWGRPILYLKPRAQFKSPKIWSKGPNGVDNLGNFDAERGWDDICNMQGKKVDTATPTPK